MDLLCGQDFLQVSSRSETSSTCWYSWRGVTENQKLISYTNLLSFFLFVFPSTWPTLAKSLFWFLFILVSYRDWLTIKSCHWLSKMYALMVSEGQFYAEREVVIWTELPSLKPRFMTLNTVTKYFHQGYKHLPHLYLFKIIWWAWGHKVIFVVGRG